jgi:hypothetical protein
MKPETLAASELTYEKFSLNEPRAKQFHETRVSTCRDFPQSDADLLSFSNFPFQSFKPRIFELTKQPNLFGF